MNKHSLIRRSVTLGLFLGTSVFLAGCATPSSMQSEGSNAHGDLTGKWAWTQGLPAPRPADLWRGEFVLEKDEDSYIGELDDVSEGTYGDTIKDVTVVDDQISFTRQGQYGTQQWIGTLKKEDGDLMIVDGHWTKQNGLTGIWSAHKID
jgi:hypothetical protein